MIIRRRLHLQIYLTILASMLAVVIVVGAIFAILRGHDQLDLDERVFDITGRLAWMALPPASAPRSEQAAAVNRLGGEFNIDITLFDSEKRPLASFGKPAPPPDEDEDESGWQRHGSGPAWLIKLPDDRWFSVNLRKEKRHRRPLFGILILLAGIAGAIGLASYPFVRKLTGRLERLQSGVEKIGTGDLSARVDVEGKDEIASLATSFNTAAGKIERLVNSNKQLLANASHELRTPLARVRLGVEMLKEKKDAKRQAALEQDIAELDGLIDEILIMSRLDTDAAPQMTEIIDMLALVAEEASRYEGCALEGEVCEIRGNTKLLRRVVRNLLDNAFKHGRPPVHVHVSKTANGVILSVQDQGEGIPTALRDKIFEPFFRAPGKQNVHGYGLGLALVKQIVEAHGGKVEISNQAQEVSELIVTLPNRV